MKKVISKAQQAVLDELKASYYTVVYHRATDSAWYYPGPNANRKRMRVVTFHALVLSGHLKKFDQIGGNAYYELKKEKTTFGIFTSQDELQTRKALGQVRLLCGGPDETVNLRFTYKDGWYTVYVDATAEKARYYHEQAVLMSNFEFDHVAALQTFKQADEGDVLNTTKLETL